MGTCTWGCGHRGWQKQAKICHRWPMPPRVLALETLITRARRPVGIRNCAGYLNTASRIDLYVCILFSFSVVVLFSLCSRSPVMCLNDMYVVRYEVVEDGQPWCHNSLLCAKPTKKTRTTPQKVAYGYHNLRQNRGKTAKPLVRHSWPLWTCAIMKKSARKNTNTKWVRA